MIKTQTKSLANKTQIKGFSLVELMIAIAITGIIAAVAIPSYVSSIQKSRRSDATATLMRLAVSQEKFYSQHGTYTTDLSSAAGLNNGSTASTQGYYGISATAGATGSITTSFILTATAGSVQAKDVDCFKFTIDSHNKRSAKIKTGTATSDCW